MTREELLIELRCLTRGLIAARHDGDLHARKVRAQAYLDGYAKALCDAGVLTQREALQLVLSERESVGAASARRPSEAA